MGVSLANEHYLSEGPNALGGGGMSMRGRKDAREGSQNFKE